jgi:hypothetical protein
MTRPSLKDVLQVGDLLIDVEQDCSWFILEVGSRDAATLCFDKVSNTTSKLIIGLVGEMLPHEELWRDGEVIIHTRSER